MPDELGLDNSQGAVPGHDGSADANGLTTSVCHSLRNLHTASIDLVRPSSEIPTRLSSLWYAQAHAVAVEEAGVYGFKAGQLLGILLDQVAQLIQQGSSLFRAGVSPCFPEGVF